MVECSHWKWITNNNIIYYKLNTLKFSFDEKKKKEKESENK